MHQKFLGLAENYTKEFIQQNCMYSYDQKWPVFECILYLAIQPEKYKHDSVLLTKQIKFVVIPYQYNAKISTKLTTVDVERFCAKKVGHEIGLTLHVFLLLLFTKVAPVA